MRKILLAVLAVLLLGTTASATLTDNQVYQLNNKMGAIPYSIQLGTLLKNVETVANSVLAEGSLWVGDNSGSAAAVSFKGNAKIPVGNGTTLNSVSVSGDVTISNAGVTAVGVGKVLETMLVQPTGAALYASRIARAVWDPSAVAGMRTVAAHGLGVILPAKAIITKAFFFTKTSVVSTNNDGTIAFSCTAVPIFAAADIDATTGVAGAKGAGIEDGTVSNMAVADGCELTATVAVDAFTAGKIDLFVEYVVAE